MKKLLLLALLVPLAACASTRAQTPPEDAPVLEVPPVPPRHIQPLPADPPAIELVSSLPNENAPATPARPRPPQRDGPNNTKPGVAADPKVETKPPDTPPDPVQTVTPPVPPLRTPGDPEGPEMARQIRDTLDRANRLLDKVHYPSLNGERQANYDNARSFIKQAEEAVKKNDLITAKSLAERAETIAKALAGS